MCNSRKNKKVLDFNGNWSSGEAAYHIGKKLTQQVVNSSKIYSRKNKSWKDDVE
jgi:hypothetical protein